MLVLSQSEISQSSIITSSWPLCLNPQTGTETKWFHSLFLSFSRHIASATSLLVWSKAGDTFQYAFIKCSETKHVRTILLFSKSKTVDDTDVWRLQKDFLNEDRTAAFSWRNKNHIDLRDALLLKRPSLINGAAADRKLQTTCRSRLEEWGGV